MIDHLLGWQRKTELLGRTDMKKNLTMAHIQGWDQSETTDGKCAKKNPMCSPAGSTRAASTSPESERESPRTTSNQMGYYGRNEQIACWRDREAARLITLRRPSRDERRPFHRSSRLRPSRLFDIAGYESTLWAAC